MKKLLKILLGTLLAIVILIIVAYLTAGIWLKTVVSTFVPQMTKTSATMEDADVSLLSGRLSLKGFKIANPDGFSNPYAFELGEISVKFEPKSLFTSKIMINEIKIDGTKVDAEISRTGNMNLMVLNNNVQEFLGNPTPATKPSDIEKYQKQQTVSESAKAVVVKDLKITNSNLSFALMGKGMKVALPNVQKKNIGEKEKETLPALVADIFGILNASSLAEMAKFGSDSVNKMLDDLAGRSNEAAGFVKSLKAKMKNVF